MHPIERLRYVARAGGAPSSSLVREAAGALAAIASDPPALVTGCRRLIERHPHVGPLWWLAARVLASAEPEVEAWRAADELDSDPTAEMLAAALPEGATVVVIGWPELAGAALMRRGDVEVLLVDAAGDGPGLARRLQVAGSEVYEVPESGLGAAVMQGDLVLLEAGALGGAEAVAVAGSLAAAAVARYRSVPAWMVAGAGTVLPARLWEALCMRLDGRQGEPWEREHEVLPLDLVDRVAGPAGLEDPVTVARRADCPVVAELLGHSGE